MNSPNDKISIAKMFLIVSFIFLLLFLLIEYFYVSGVKKKVINAQVTETYQEFTSRGGQVKLAKLKLEDNQVVSAIVKGCWYNKTGYSRVSVYLTPIFNKKKYVIECSN